LLKNKDPKNMTTNAFGKDLNTENHKESFNTQYPFKGPLKRIPEQNEEEPFKYSRRSSKESNSEMKAKRGKSMYPNKIKSTRSNKSVLSNNVAYQTDRDFHEENTGMSRHYINNSPAINTDSKKNYQRAGSLIARSTSYSTVPCPHCERMFSMSAAERHIPICKNIQNKPTALRHSVQKRSNVMLPNLSKTDYGSGFDSNLMNNTSSTFLTSATKAAKEQLSLTQTTGLPPTHKMPSSKTNTKARADFAMKK